MAGTAALVGLECLGLAALLRDWPLASPWGFFVGHGLAGVAAATLWAWLPRDYRDDPAPRNRLAPPEQTPAVRPDDRKRRRRASLFLALLVLFLPLFGMLGVLVALLPALHHPVVKRRRDWLRLAIPPLPPSPGTRDGSPVAGGRSLIDILRDPDSSVDSRVAAVLALRQLPTRTAVPILRSALRDSSDDVRLLAYAMLDQSDSRLQTRIQDCDEKLAGGRQDGAEAATLHYLLAHLHWELVYTGLVTGAVKDRELDRAERHARATGAHADLATTFLLGRILLEKGDLDRAESRFNDAAERGFSAQSVAPYLAEIAFRRRDFAAVRTHLESLSRGELPLAGVTAALEHYWLADRSSVRVS